jgi:hypothetical protein
MARSQGLHEIRTGDVKFIYAFTRQGRMRETLVLLPGAVFSTMVLTPGSRRCVSMFAAMPFNLGDGAVLRIFIADETRERQAIELNLDPAHIRAHRAWTPIRFEIPQGMDHFTLRFEVNPGPRGDGVADWMGLAAGDEAGCLLSG